MITETERDVKTVGEVGRGRGQTDRQTETERSDAGGN